MERIRFGRTGVTVPRIGLGTWAYGGPNKAGDRSVGWTHHSDEAARDAVVTAFELGADHWDTADVYGDGRSERLLGGIWDRIPRDRVFLATKVGWDRGSYDHWYHPELMRSRLERSLANLRTDAVDLYYLHHCDFGPDDEYFDAAAAAIHRFRDEGLIRFIGLSDWSSARVMRFIERLDPDVVQVLRNVGDDQYADSGLKAFVEAHDLGAAFFSPLRHGLLLGKYDAPVTFDEGDFRRHDPGFSDPAVIARMKASAAALRERFPDHPEPVLHGVLGALMADSPTGVALVGMRNARQARAAVAAGAALSPEDAAWVWRLFGRD